MYSKPISNISYNNFIVCITSVLLVFFISIPQNLLAQSSESIVIKVLWDESRPFIYKDENGKITGIEVEILNRFKEYVYKKNKKVINFDYLKQPSFIELFNNVKESDEKNLIGSAAFSITEERKKHIDFSEPYMNDISVLISNTDVPVAKTESEFVTTISNLSAYTISGTTYESDLKYLKENRQIPFQLKYINSNENVLRTIESTSGSFGYIDLFIYLMYYNQNPSLHINRQNFYLAKKEGYAFIFPKNSELKNQLNQFFKDQNLSQTIDSITRNYIDLSVYKFLDSLAANTVNYENSLLSKEKEIQSSNLLWKNEMLKRESFNNIILSLLLILVAIFGIIIYVLFRKTRKINSVLEQQKHQIETQSRNIENQNLQLDRKNKRLLNINEEKNNLIRILAHDLRAPLAQILGLAELLKFKKDTLSKEDYEIILMMNNSISRMQLMVNKILNTDAIDLEKSNLIYEQIEMNETLTLIIQNFSIVATQKEIDIQFSKSISKCYVNADYIFLVEVFENLISNAIKFSFRKSKILISCNELEDDILVKVTDFGVGLNEEDLSVLFNKFQKLSSMPTEGESSNGIGLWIVSKYVKMFQGKVWCESDKQNGTCFYVQFPKVNFATK